MASAVCSTDTVHPTPTIGTNLFAAVETQHDTKCKLSTTKSETDFNDTEDTFLRMFACLSVEAKVRVLDRMLQMMDSEEVGQS
jgi:hypothetical protein